jgi:SOS-response transcriptional repressor LexA
MHTTATQPFLLPISTLAIRLKKARRVRNVTQQELANRIGVKQQAIQRIEAGKVRSSTYIVTIALALQVSPIWLAGGQELEPILLDHNMHTDPSQAIFPSLPLFSWNEISNDIKPLYKKGDIRPQVPAFMSVSNKAFALQLQLPDDAMVSMTDPKASFQRDAMVFIDPSRTPKDGSFILVKTSELILRKYVTANDSGAYLAALNNKYESVLWDPNRHTIIGVLIAKYISLV